MIMEKKKIKTDNIENDVVEITENLLKEKLYEVRGAKVMLDSDLAEIYGYETKAFNQQVKRNIDRFPEDFLFRIEPGELPASLKSQNVILNDSGNRRGMHMKKMPNAFTEQGFSVSNLQFMRRFYQTYQIQQTVSVKLSWSHYCELLSISDQDKRSFYEKECERCGP